MEEEFESCFEELIESSIRRLKNALIMKLEAIKKCENITRGYDKAM
jgi:hypothetical protein